MSRTTFGLFPVGVLLAGCSVSSDPYTTDAETGSRHASIQVERSETVEGPQRAGVVAGFVQLPADTDRATAMRWVGMGSEVPELGQCSLRFPDADDVGSTGPMEFLDAGDVSVTVAGQETLLAARALPTVTDLISGVVYTTLDQDTEPLPAGEEYFVRSTGGILETTLDIRHTAPDTIEVVTVGGTPLAEIDSVSLATPIDLTWSVGSPEDRMYVEVSVSDAAFGCTFRDDIGAGTLVIRGLEPADHGRIALRRIRSASFADAELDNGELRFDFELTHSLTLDE